MKVERSKANDVRRFIGHVAGIAIMFGMVSPSPVAAQTLLSPNEALYARVRHLADGELLAAVTAFNPARIDVYSSVDNGASFYKAGQIDDPEFADGICCGTIFQLPAAVGALPAGTLLWAGSVGGNKTPPRQMKIKVYLSADNGRTWSFLSQIAAPNTGGLWEPEFSIASDGALVMMYSDETNSAYSQRLIKTRTYTGTSWVDTANLVASTVQADRPGMAIVSKLASGTRLMTFELCGPAACTAFYKTSADGWNWGSAAAVGSAIRLPDGRYFAHTPYNTVLPDGSILLVGQILMNSNNTPANGNGNGTTILKSASGNPAGPWTAIAAPVTVPSPDSSYCPNYSSPLLALSNTTVLEFAGRKETACRMYFNTGPAN